MKKLGQRGFTLIELMIVVAIIGILAAVAIPKFADMLRKSKEGATKGSLTNLKSALTIYVSDNEGSTPFLTATDVSPMVPKYIETVPSVKLGTYHPDSNALFCPASNPAYNVDFDGNKSSATVGAGGNAGGWAYTCQGGGSFWVNSSNTDTKNVKITSW